MIKFESGAPLGMDTVREWSLSRDGETITSGCTSTSGVEIALESVEDLFDALEEEVKDDGYEYPSVRAWLAEWFGEEEFEKILAERAR